MYRIICLVIALYCSLAADVTVYRIHDYDNVDPQKLEPVAVSQFPWKFGYVGGDLLYLNIFISNKSPSVTMINVTRTLDERTFEMWKTTRAYGQRKGQEYYYTSFDPLYTAEIQIRLNLYRSNILCSSFLIAKGRNVEEIAKVSLKNKFPYYNCGGHGCAVVVDLINECVGPPLVTRTTMKPFTDVLNSNNKTLTNNVLNTAKYENIDPKTVKNATNTAGRQSPQNIVLIYLIPSVIGMCIIILVIYLISGKKYCHRNSHAVETVEMNTYSTANEVVYADLGFEPGDRQPPRREEEPTYAQITGVLKPANTCRNTRNK